jgi:hypothetical protein
MLLGDDKFRERVVGRDIHLQWFCMLRATSAVAAVMC